MYLEHDIINIGLIAPVPPPYGGIANWTKMMLEKSSPSKVNYKTINIAPKKRMMEGRTLFDRIVVSGLESFRLRKQLKELLKDNKIDVIHMTTSGQFAIFRDILLMRVARKRNVPAVYHIRFGRVAEMGKKNTFEWKMFKVALGLADAIIAIDQSTFNYLKPAYDSKVHYIPNPICMESITQADNTERQVTFLGWCIKNKGVEELLEAWQSLDVGEWKLNIVGPYSQEYLNQLKEKYQTHQVVFHGELDHESALEVLGKSEIFTLPSYTEGFPNVILEAMALKKAIIATKVGAIPEMLKDNCGELIDKQNVEQLAQALGKLMKDEKARKAYGMNAHKRVCENYEFSTVLNTYRSLWLDIKIDKEASCAKA